jgi:hypothetical protein
MSEPQYIDPRTLRPGPIRHESLPPDLLGQIRAVFDVIGPHIDMTLEQFEIDFMRDMPRNVRSPCGAGSRKRGWPIMRILCEDLSNLHVPHRPFACAYWGLQIPRFARSRSAKAPEWPLGWRPPLQRRTPPSSGS